MGRDLGIQYVRIDNSLLLPKIDYGMHIQLDDPEGLPAPNPLAIHKADVCIEMNGRKVELTYEQLAVAVGLKPH